jgi:hypothetical protein
MSANPLEKLPADVQAAMLSIRSSALREELLVEEIDAPTGIADHAIAFSAGVKSETSEVSGNLGTGRFVMFWSSVPQENWTTNFRIVCFARSPLESNIAADAESTDITWDWLTDALAIAGAEHSALAGTTTRIVSSGHGMMSSEADHAEIELRASWSPHGTEIGRHFVAWQNVVSVMSGFTLTPGVGEVHR